MAKAFIKRSVRGNDLVNLTLGPKETASVVALLSAGPLNEHAQVVYNELTKAQFTSRNAKYASVKVTVPEKRQIVLS